MVNDLTRMMLQFSKTNYNYRAIKRNKLEEFSQTFDWHQLVDQYLRAYTIAMG